MAKFLGLTPEDAGKFRQVYRNGLLHLANLSKMTRSKMLMPDGYLKPTIFQEPADRSAVVIG